MERVVVPEILDSLPVDDPRAMRSRRDLRVVDFFMGNSRWIVLEVARSGAGRVSELGAGEGVLCAKVKRAVPGAEVEGFDFCPRPVGLSAGIGWNEGDFFQTLGGARGGACVGSLVLHHFGNGALQELGGLLRDFSILIFSEPLRSRVSLVFSKLAAPLFGAVTRHDMPVSIRAGFLPGELGGLLGLESACWRIAESRTKRGALRFLATRL